MWLSLNDKLTQLFVLLGLVFLTGCSSLGTFNPATGKNEFIFIPTTQEVAMGGDVHRTLDKQYKFSNQPDLVNRVNRIGNRIASISDRQDYRYQFFVVEQDQLNAFTTPGGNVYIFTGLLKFLKTDDQLASVMAHEIGHCAARHTIKKFQASLGYNLVGSLLLSTISEGMASQIANLSAGAVTNIVMSSYGRKDEYEADMLGLKYMIKAGYDPQGMIEAFSILESNTDSSQGPPLLLRSHPYISDRIRSIQNQIPKAQAQYAAQVQ